MLSTQFIALLLGLIGLFALRAQYQKALHARHLQMQNEVLTALEPLKGIQYDLAFWDAIIKHSPESTQPSSIASAWLQKMLKHSFLFNANNSEQHLEVLRPTKIRGPFIALTWLIPGILIEILSLPWAWYLLFGALITTLIIVYKKIKLVGVSGEKFHTLPRVMYNIAMGSKVAICADMILLLSLHATLSILNNKEASTEQKDKAIQRIVLDFQSMFKKGQELSSDKFKSYPEYSETTTLLFNYYAHALAACAQSNNHNIDPLTLDTLQ